MAAATRLDEAAAQMVSQALRAEGAEAMSLPPRAPLPRALGAFKPETLILVTLDPVQAANVDLQIRQLRRRLPGVRIGLAQWPGPGEDESTTRLKSLADFSVTGMEQVFAQAFGKPDAKAA